MRFTLMMTLLMSLCILNVHATDNNSYFDFIRRQWPQQVTPGSGATWPAQYYELLNKSMRATERKYTPAILKSHANIANILNTGTSTLNTQSHQILPILRKFPNQPNRPFVSILKEKSAKEMSEAYDNIPDNYITPQESRDIGKSVAHSNNDDGFPTTSLGTSDDGRPVYTVYNKDLSSYTMGAELHIQNCLRAYKNISNNIMNQEEIDEVQKECNPSRTQKLLSSSAQLHHKSSELHGNMPNFSENMRSVAYSDEPDTTFVHNNTTQEERKAHMPNWLSYTVGRWFGWYK